MAFALETPHLENIKMDWWPLGFTLAVRLSSGLLHSHYKNIEGQKKFSPSIRRTSNLYRCSSICGYWRLDYC